MISTCTRSVLFGLLVLTISCNLEHFGTNEAEEMQIYGYRQNYSAFTHQPVGEPYLWYIETRNQSMHVATRSILYSYGDTLYHWRYDPNGRPAEQWYKQYRMKFLYPSDTSLKYTSAETYLAKSASATPESVHRIDSCKMQFFPDGRKIFQCWETCLGLGRTTVRRMSCTYDSLSRPTSRSIYNPYGELQDYINTTYDSTGRISEMLIASLPDQHQERIDYTYDKRGFPVTAKGYLGTNAETKTYTDFTVTFRQEK